MASSTVSTRLDPDELKLLESLAELHGFDRSTMVKSLLRRGMAELRLELAADAFRKEQVTLSRSAEIAGLSLWDLVARMQDHKLDIHYDVEELEADLANLADVAPRP